MAVPEEELGGQGDLVFGENYLYLGSRICRLGSWLIWLKYSTLLTPWCPVLTFPRTGAIAKMERIIVAGAWSSEGEAAGREEKVGKKGGCGLMPGYQAMEEKSKI